MAADAPRTVGAAFFRRDCETSMVPFAQHLRAQNIAANASDRVVRRVTIPRKPDGIYRANIDGRSTHMRSRRESVETEMRTGALRIKSGKRDLLHTRDEIERGWSAVSNVLIREGKAELATQVRLFVSQMSPPQTEKELIAIQWLNRIREPRNRDERARTC
jgi:hypothetical protein